MGCAAILLACVESWSHFCTILFLSVWYSTYTASRRLTGWVVSGKWLWLTTVTKGRTYLTLCIIIMDWQLKAKTLFCLMNLLTLIRTDAVYSYDDLIYHGNVDSVLIQSASSHPRELWAYGEKVLQMEYTGRAVIICMTIKEYHHLGFTPHLTGGGKSPLM